MRHKKKRNKLGRTASHRKATLANLSRELFRHKHITTTETKAKVARSFSEKLVTLAKKDSVHARRMAMKKLRDKKSVKLLFDDIAPKYESRKGGYTRIVKLGQRQGDSAPMAILELVGFETAEKKKKAKDEKKKEQEAEERNPLSK